MTEKIFDRLLKDPVYKQLLEQLSEDEKVVVIKSLKEITERFEKEVYTPLKNYLAK